MDRESIDWKALHSASTEGMFMEQLVKLPRARWAELDPMGKTLLHYACMGPNVSAVVALVQSGLVDVNARNRRGGTPAHAAALNKQPRVLEALCAVGAHLRARNHIGFSTIDIGLWVSQDESDETARVLVANGVRLSTVRDNRRKIITPELEAFEHGVLRCRAAVVAMLRVKRAGKLWMWDKFLMAEMAFCIWATRYDKGWQTAMQ